jgi:ABC-type multidrug transport system ATPase subunit
MVQTVDMVQLINLTTYGDPELFNYGKMRDLCHQFSYTFNAGKAYGVVGECGSGGWGLTYALSGRGGIINGEIKINEMKADKEKLYQYTCYVGGDSIRKRNFWTKKSTVRKQIENGLKENQLMSFNEICELFELSSSRLDRNIEHVGNERWNASMAIGLAQGKKIYCFPWLYTGTLNVNYKLIKNCVNVLKERGGIIIIPSAKAEKLSQFVDEITFISHPDEQLEIGD